MIDSFEHFCERTVHTLIEFNEHVALIGRNVVFNFIHVKISKSFSHIIVEFGRGAFIAANETETLSHNNHNELTQNNYRNKDHVCFDADTYSP